LSLCPWFQIQQTRFSAQLRSAAAHASVSGNIHFVADDDKHAIALASKLLSFIPSNNIMDPPHDFNTPLPTEEDPGMNEIIPDSPKKPLNVHDVIYRLVDDGDFLEVMMDWAKNMVIGFARIGGVVVGIIANEPMVKAGCLDIDASDKAARFIRFCNIFNIPLVSLVDVPGFFPGVAQERGGIIRHGAKMLFAYAASTVPKITLILRKAYGGAYLAMCSRDMGADLVYAWPTAELGFMAPDVGIAAVHRRVLEEAMAEGGQAGHDEVHARLEQEWHDESQPWEAAANFHLDDVIEPGETRRVVVRSIEVAWGSSERVRETRR